MIQRKQSLFLLAVVFITGAGVLWGLQDNQSSYFQYYPYGYLLVLMITFLSIFSFKNRKRQLVLNTINIGINALLMGVLAYYLLTLPGEDTELFSEKGIELFIPLINIVLLVLANNYIQRDEKLVKSVDRLR